jgi:hypothetical protein
MSEQTITVLAVVIGIGLAFYFLRGRISELTLRWGSFFGGVRAHESKGVNVRGLHQESEEAGNSATMKNENVSIDNMKQKGKGDNILDIKN